MPIIQFDPVQFKIDYPQFADISDARLANEFSYSATVLGNAVASIFLGPEEQYYWICVVLAHSLTLETQGISGQISKVVQGSESIEFNFSTPDGLEYWGSTPYGQKIIAVMQQYLSGIHYYSDGVAPYIGQGARLWNYSGN